MYDELIEQLRASCEGCKLWDGYRCCLKGDCIAQIRLQAADTIEGLSHAVDQMAEWQKTKAADVRPVPEGGIGEMSDGYHTFNGLYYQRMVLFAALVKAYKDKAWKSWKHEDGEPCFGGGWFIVGIDTPQGSYTYHYEAKDFDLFDCEELPVAKHWDGHTEEDVTRLLTLDVRPVVRGKWIPDYDYAEYDFDGSTPLPEPQKFQDGWQCSLCGGYMPHETNYCPNCGADMRGTNDEKA